MLHRLCLILLSLLFINAPLAQAEPSVLGYVAPSAGFTLFKPTDISLAGSLSLGIDGGYRIGHLGYATLHFNTAIYDADTQMSYYLVGFSREIIWGIALSASLGLQSMFDHEVDAGMVRVASPTGTNFAYGVSASFMTTPVLSFRPDLELQIVPDISFYRTSFINWYSGTLQFRFNFLNP